MKTHLSNSFENIRRAPFQALAAISVLVLTFFVSTLLTLLVFGSNQVVNYFETRPQVIAFLTEDAEALDIATLQQSLEKDLRVQSVSFVSKEEALEIYKSATADNPLLGELVSPSIFPASIEFSVANLEFAEELISEVQAQEIVESIGFTASVGGDSSLGEIIGRLKSIALYVRIGGLVAVSVLGVTSILVLMVVIGLRVTVKREEIDNLSLIGATPWFIRAPILLEAIIYAIFGAILGWLLSSVVVLYSTPTVLSYFDPIEVLPRNTQSFFLLLGAILAVEIVAGIIIATLSSLFSVGRSLKMTKK